MQLKLEDGGSEEVRQWDVHVGVDWSAYADSNFVGSWRMRQSRGHLENQATFNRGATSRDSHYMLSVDQVFDYDVSVERANVYSRMHVTLPARAIDVKLVVAHQRSNFKLDTFLLARYAAQKELQCGLLLERKPGIAFLADGAFNLTLPSRSLANVKGRIQETSKDTFEVFRITISL